MINYLFYIIMSNSFLYEQCILLKKAMFDNITHDVQMKKNGLRIFYRFKLLGHAKN